MKRLTLLGIAFGICDAVEPGAYGRGKVCDDARTSRGTRSEICGIYGVDACEEVHRRDEDVDVSTACKLECLRCQRF